MEELVLIGKSELLGRVNEAFSAEKLSHALLIEGNKGIGKTVCAKEICKIILAGSDAVGMMKIDKGIHPDVFEVFPAGKSETIGVHEIAPIKEKLYIKPNDADYKVFVIHRAERMNRVAQNSILKMIEEPPEDTFFIFTCENSRTLLATVRSRVTCLRVSSAEKEEVAKELERRFPGANADLIGRAASVSCGNVGLAVELCGGGGLMKIYDDAAIISTAVFDRDRAKLCLVLGGYCGKKEELVKLTGLLKSIFRDVCAASSSSAFFTSGFEKEVKEISKICSAKSALEIMNACDECRSAVYSNANPSLCVTALEIKMSKAVGR